MSYGMDLLAGLLIGGLGGSQGVALPGLLLVGLGYDTSIALAYQMNPDWFPQSQPLTLSEVATTGAGTAVGWALAKALFPTANPSGMRAMTPIALAGMAMMPFAGRVPGR